VIQAQAKGVYVDQVAGRVTLGEFAEEWLASKMVEPTTVNRLSSDLTVHVLPHFGHRPLAAIRPSEIQAWIKGRSQVLSPGSVENAYRVLTGLLSAATRDRLIGTTPAVGIVLPRKPKTEVVIPTDDEVSVLLDAMPDRYRIAGELAAFAGLRQGEALGLTLDRIDFLRRTLKVDRQMRTTKGQPTFGPPKSEASYRVIPLADGLLAALSAHVASFPPGPDALLVTYVDGRPVRRNRFGAMWRQSKARAGLSFRYHDLRHYYASGLIDGGCSVPELRDALGDRSAKVIFDTYAHLMPTAEGRIRAASDAAYRRCALGVPSTSNSASESPGERH